MDLLFSHIQKNIDRKTKNESNCRIELYSSDDSLFFSSYFESEYFRFEKKKTISYEHNFSLSLSTGDIVVSYKLTNKDLEPKVLLKNTFKKKKNDFSLLEHLISSGIVRGEKRVKFWGQKYEEEIKKLTKIFEGILLPKIDFDFYVKKLKKEKESNDYLFKLIVDFHLSKKMIRGHDNVYNHIKYEYPQKVWLKKNDNKFLPALLDMYGIKSKYFIGEINKSSDKMISIKSLSYICKLFGNNYIDHIKNIPWKDKCFDLPPNKKIHKLKNESEKKFLAQLIKNWDKEHFYKDSFIYLLNKLFSLREELESIGYVLKFNAKNVHDFENLMQIWMGHLKHHKRGYRVKYKMNDVFVNDIEENINVNGLVYKPKILQSEDDFRFEGFKMKNCMAQQFIHGAIYVYVSLSVGRKTINIQYRKGKMVQSFGKANTDTPELFEDALKILNKRFEKWETLTWKKEKYDIIGM